MRVTIGRHRQEWLRTFLKLPGGMLSCPAASRRTMPSSGSWDGWSLCSSPSVSSNGLSCPKAVATHGATGGTILAIDGKSLLCSLARDSTPLLRHENPQAMLHPVWNDGGGDRLGQ